MLSDLLFGTEEYNDFLDGEDPDYDWVIPNLLERGDRAIFTGGEGKGKSTLLRQIAVATASGIHAFTLQPIEPKRVWYIDLENPKRTVRREMRKHFGDVEIPHGRLLLSNWSQGVDLHSPNYVTAMTEVFKQFRPDLVVVGPMYKMSSQPLEREEHSKGLALVLDTWLSNFEFALVMESHQPHGTVVPDVDPKRRMHRPERPVGSSLWMRWPEFGYCLEDAGVLRPWRGKRDDDRAWPEKLIRGEEWPWMVSGGCLRCGLPLSGKQERYCSEKCASAVRQAKYRQGVLNV